MVEFTNTENMIPEWISSLNAEQRDAVNTTEGPLLVLSGAGTGKTKVLTTRIAYILYSGRAKPYEIFGVTFTNKAAGEMKSRIRDIIGSSADSLWLGTFHSIGFRILRKHFEKVGLSNNFVIFDNDDQKRLLKKILVDNFGMDIKKAPPGYVVELISRFKDKGISPENQEIFNIEDSAAFDGKIVPIYQEYQKQLKEMNAVDFGDLLLYPLEIFHANKDILEEYQNRFKYILVDEYQDTNYVQYKVLKMLAEKHKNICCVGDDDQSIYSWRGAEITNILNFDKEYPNAKIIRLETNYRSTKHILSAASALIDHNSGRLGKTLRPADHLDVDDAVKVQVRGVFSSHNETDSIADEIDNFQRQGLSLKDMAILVRAGWQTRAFEEKFVRAGIPYKIIGGTKFYERLEIKDALAYLRLLIYPNDNISFERIINMPKRGIGDKTIGSISAFARDNGIPMLNALEEMLKTGHFKNKLKDTFNNFLNNYYRWLEILSGNKLSDKGESYHHGELVKIVLEESGYIGMWEASKKADAEGRIENLQELVGNISMNFDSIPEFLEHIALIMDNSEQDNYQDEISIMTLHGAKGLEFDVVFLPGWEVGIFPNQKVIEETGNEGVEEERRLAYVGITRAKKVAMIYYAGSRQVFGQWQNNMPSNFIFELPKEEINHVSFTNAFNN